MDLSERRRFDRYYSFTKLRKAMRDIFIDIYYEVLEEAATLSVSNDFKITLLVRHWIYCFDIKAGNINGIRRT